MEKKTKEEIKAIARKFINDPEIKEELDPITRMWLEPHITIMLEDFADQFKEREPTGIKEGDIEREAEKDFIHPKNKRGDPISIPAGHIYPHGWQKFLKAYKKGFIRALSLLSKEQNNEAVEFSIWLSANEWVYLQNGSTFTHYVEGERDVLELYQIFKQRK
jgi:hypothetical protein